MATVRMSQRLISEMVSAAMRKFEKQYPEKEFPILFGDSIASSLKLYEKSIASQQSMQNIWGEVAKHFDGTFEVSAIRISSTIKATGTDEEDKEYNHYDKTKEYTLALSTPLSIPDFLPNVSYECMRLKVEPTNEIFVQCYAIDQENRAISDKRYEFRRQTRATLNEFTTLNQALKATNGAYAALVDQETMTKVMKKDDRSARNAELAVIAENELSELREVLLTDSLLGDN